MFKINNNIQQHPGYRFWDEEQCSRIHQNSLKLLEENGVKITNQQALKLLKNAGCSVSSNQVKIPPLLVREMITGAPERAVLTDALGERSIVLERNRVNFGTLNTGTNPAESGDLFKVVESLLNFDFIGLQGFSVEHFQTIRAYSRKPVLYTVGRPGNLQALIKMSQITGGNGSDLMIYIAPENCLELGDITVNKLFSCAEEGIAVIYLPQEMLNTVSSGSIACSLARANAGCLAGLVVHQLHKRGAPFIYGSKLMPLGRDGSQIYGGPETSLFNAGSVAMGKYYNLPTYGNTGSVHFYNTGLAGAMNATFGLMSAAFAGSSLINVLYSGEKLESDLKYLLMIDEIAGMVKHFMKGVSVDDETVPLDLIDQVGPGGEFVTSEHTMRHFKSETWFPRFMNRAHFSKWLNEDGKAMGDKLEAGVEEILKREDPGGVSQEQLTEMAGIIEDLKLSQE